MWTLDALALLYQKLKDGLDKLRKDVPGMAPVQSVNGATGAVSMERLLIGQTSSISTYPTKCGRYAVYSDIFANMNPDSPYGWLTISGGGSYAEHRFIDSHGCVYFGWGSPSTEPSTWTRMLENKHDVYNPGDTYETINYGVFPCVVANAMKYIYIEVPVDKSMEKISTITVSIMKGWFAGCSGTVDGNSSSDYSWLTSSYTVSAVKISQTVARVFIQKSTAFTNIPANGTPVNFYGALKLTFS